MNRRNFIIAHSALLAGVAQADTPKVQSLDEALRWLDRLDKAASKAEWAMMKFRRFMASS